MNIDRIQEIIIEEINNLIESQRDGNNLGDANSYYTITKSFPVYVMIGSVASNASYGTSRLHKPVWKKIMATAGDQLQNLYGGLFFVDKSGKAYTVHLEEPEFSPFTRGRSFVDKFDLNKLKEIEKSQGFSIKRRMGEAEGDNKDKEKVNKEKEKVDQQKADFNKQKLDFNKQKLDYTQDKDREKDQADQEKEKEAPKGGSPFGGGGQGEAEPEVKPNISFKDQGQFYEEAYPELRNLALSDGNLLNDDERKFIALAVQAAQGRMDKGFIKFLSKGRAGNIYGKDFSNEDKKKIIDYCKEHELVR